jgi:hypothetical protein
MRVAGQVTFRLTEEDFVAAERDWLRDRFSGRNATINLATSILALFLALVLVAEAWLSYGRLPWPPDFWVLLLLLVGGSYWLALGWTYLGTARRARRLFGQRAALRELIDYGWSEAGLNYANVHGSGCMPWADVYRWHAGKSCYLVFIDERMSMFIPRAVLTDAQAQDLETTVNAAAVRTARRLEAPLNYA